MVVTSPCGGKCRAVGFGAPKPGPNGILASSVRNPDPGAQDHSLRPLAPSPAHRPENLGHSSFQPCLTCTERPRAVNRFTPLPGGSGKFRLRSPGRVRGRWGAPHPSEDGQLTTGRQLSDTPIGTSWPRWP